VKKVIAVIVMVVVGLVTACAPAAPTPTPTLEPTPTPVEVLATKSEHLAGLWFNAWAWRAGGEGRYYRFEADGTLRRAGTREGLEETNVKGRFWFEDGVYYEESGACFAIGSYRAYLEIEGGRAVGLCFEEIDDSDPSQGCSDRSSERRTRFNRVD
jgi:hypothetical protein